MQIEGVHKGKRCVVSQNEGENNGEVVNVCGKERMIGECSVAVMWCSKTPFNIVAPFAVVITARLLSTGQQQPAELEDLRLLS